jgi:hypothetical protein
MKDKEFVKSPARVPIWIFVFLAIVPFAVENQSGQLTDIIISACLLLIASLICIIDKFLNNKWYWERREKKKKKRSRI